MELMKQTQELFAERKERNKCPADRVLQNKRSVSQDKTNMTRARKKKARRAANQTGMCIDQCLYNKHV